MTREPRVAEPVKVELPPHCPTTAPEKATERPLCVTTTVPMRQQQLDWTHPFCTAYEPAHVTSPGAGAAVVAGGGDVGGNVGVLVDETAFKSKLYVSKGVVALNDEVIRAAGGPAARDRYIRHAR